MEAAYRELRDQILDGLLPAGATLRQETLAANLGLSTTPLREALSRLAAEGLVVLQAHRDMSVAPLRRDELEQILSVRLLLDPYAASLATNNATDVEIETMLRLAQHAHARGIRDELHANRAFHRAIYAASGNLPLTQILDSLWDRTDRYRSAAFAQGHNLKLVTQDHLRIARALKSRNARLVASMVRKHIEFSKRLLMFFSE